MKKIFASFVFILVTVCAYSQKDVTQFLGIPVDGSKSDMIQKLKAKGFHTSPYNNDVLNGTFNGVDVNLHIITNNDKVCRIMLRDVNPVDERSIQIRFNTLCRQFEKNPKYISVGYELIPNDEDISYEIRIKNKRYEAAFYQKPAEFSDSTLLQERVKEFLPTIYEKYTLEELGNPTDEIQTDIMNMSLEYLYEFCTKKPVWFMISDFYGKYYITMYYDNEYNRANGEDL
ncbi:MAG: hypothetical protein K2G01_04880 [Paramuribaculum sp.]|nr:hypothetical protein [Paramuribaculum sp.]